MVRKGKSATKSSLFGRKQGMNAENRRVKIKSKLTSEELRSHRWYGVDDLRSFGHRSRMNQMGYGSEDYQGKPVIGIINTWSDINPCHTHFRTRVEEIKRGVWQAGGFPVELQQSRSRSPSRSLPRCFIGTFSRWRPKSNYAHTP